MNKLVASALDLLAVVCLIYWAATADCFARRDILGYFLVFATIVAACYLAFRALRG